MAFRQRSAAGVLQPDAPLQCGVAGGVCFHELDENKAVGIDGVTKAQYAEHLEENLQELVDRMKRMAYRPLPMRQALILNEEKTRLVRFSKRAQRRGDQQGGFDFLGFTFYLGRSRRGVITPKLKTSGKRLRGKLERVSEWARGVHNVLSLKQIWRVFGAKLRGHIQYYGVSFNGKAVNEFVYQATRILFGHLNHRSQRKSFTWEKFGHFREAHPLPPVKLHHALY